MPELPDVEGFKRQLETTALGEAVDRVEVRDASILAGVSAKELAEGLAGRTLRSAARRGKYLAVGLDGDGGHLVFHFGMTGQLLYFGGVDEDSTFDRVRLVFKSGRCLVFDCARKLGRVRLVRDLEDFWRSKRVGPDVLDGLDEDGFVARLAGRKGAAKAALMDQSLFSGIGNVYSDEILFQARLHPKQRLGSLGEEDLRRLYTTARQVLQKAVDIGGDEEKTPEGWLLASRRKGAPCPGCSGKVERMEIGGRGSYFCPSCQKE